MSSLRIIAIDDQDEYLVALKKVLEAKLTGCRVKTLCPVQNESFDAFFGRIEEASGDCLVMTVILLDRHLGHWKWSGANLAPSLCNVISISTDIVPWSTQCFRKKRQIVDGDNAAMEELVSAIKEVAAPFYS